MYRISRVFETPSVAIVKIAGHVADSDLEAWRGFLEELGSEGGFGIEPTRWTVLDFCDVSSVGRAAAVLLVEQLPRNVLLLNALTAIKNMAASVGFASQILEPQDAFLAEAAVVGTTLRKRTG